MGKLTLLDAYHRLREAAEERLAARVSALPLQGAEITCRSGCSACCRQLVVVSPLEAHAIAAQVEAHPELGDRVAARLRHWLGKVETHPELVQRLDAFTSADGYVSGEDGGGLELAYWRAQLPCPFLEDHHCSIYRARPFACREHHAVSAPELCSVDPDAVTPADTRMEYRVAASFVGSRAFGLTDRLIPLPLALEYARNGGIERYLSADEPDVQWALETGQRQARRAQALLMLSQRRSAPSSGSG